MNLNRALNMGPVVLLIVIGCGSNDGGFDANKVTVTVTPATATVAASGTVTLQAAVHGLCSTCTSAINDWEITENSGDPSCNWFDSSPPPTTSCPGGTIHETTGPDNFLTVTYHAPSAAGTFHVVAEWCICFGSSITKDGTSVITVGP